MPLYGRLEPFEGDGSAWPIYEEQVHVFFRANDTPEEKQRDIFLASCGTQVFSLLLDLLKPATPHTKTLSELLTTLRSHFSPASSTLMERFRFNNRSRREGESLGQFVAALRGLASTCAFGDQLDSLLRDRFVCGINSPAMQTRLLELPDPSLDDVVKAALAMDAATKDAGEIARAASTEAAVNKMVARDGICSRCGDAHSPSQCQFVHSQCFTCGKTGHLARVCRTGKQNSAPQQQPGSSPGSTTARGQGRRRKWRRGRAAAGSGSSAARLNVVSENPPIFDMWHTGLVPSSVPPYVLTVEVCGRPISMELDTGASVSVMAGKLFKRTFPGVAVEASGVMLRSYSGELSQVEGQAQVSVRFGNREATLPLYLTKGSSPTLLGRNWICALGVRLPEGQEAALHGLQDIPSLLTDFQSLFQPGVGTFAGTTAGIHVPEGVRPRFFKPRPLPFALKDGVTQELQRLQREGILVPVKTAEWAAPIVPVPKRDGSVRICGDFKVTINPVATVEKYPLPRIEDLWSALSGGQKFTKLDLRDAYQQLVLQEASRKYVTISTTMGLFQYTRLPFGVTSAPAIFQREMDNLFRGMKHVAVYLDDILVTGIDDGDHMQNLHNVLARLQDAGLKLKREKCVFMVPSVEYLGHVISQAGLTPAPRKVEAVLKAPKPRNKKELQSYLGLINFYRRFLPNLSAHLQPLHILLRDGQHWVWKKEQDVAFEHSKQLITKAPVLVHFDPAKPVVLTVDASPYGVGAVLAHRDKDGQERPVSFASRRLHTAEQRYSHLDKEGLALMFGVERFHQYLWGRKFEAVTDHKPLLGLLGPDKAVPVQASPRVVRWALKLAAYSYQLVYRPGKDLGPADALSRLPLPEVPAAVPEPAEVLMLEHAYPEVLSRSAVSQATSRDPVLSQVVKAVSRGEELVQQPYSHKAAELSLEQGCLLWGSRVVIPQSLRSRVLQLLHAGHPGVEKTKMVARSHVWWPGLDQDIAHMVQSCQVCQEHQRASRHVEITPWPFPQRPWSRLHVDFGGPFKGHYFLVIVDAFSKWVEVLPVTTPSAGATIAALRQVFAAQGLPDIIVSDNGPAFASAEYLAWLTKNGIRRMMVPPYHPASNGAAERVVQTIKDKLKKSQAGDFRTQVARILFQYRTTPHDVTGRAPCELLLGRMVKTPLDILHPDLRSTALLKQLKQKLAADKGCRPWPLPEPGVPVFARNFRSGPPWSAGQVVAPASSSSLLVRMQDGTTWHRHADHVRANRGTWLASTATPVAASETAISQGTGASSGAPLVGPPASSVPSLPTTAVSQEESSVAQAAPGATAPSPSTPVPRRSNRRRRAPDRFSPT
ncbi:uncharacterized protein K02A2.6-like [Rhipicephalus sanguineus]|uniref:uncharacterized protein K02A2.6-like n=1 Tax=Rhipicephalus sanguineus TaxID=34632 RepID=UPI001893F578|nr:uncharacterized protein K02A2.6-like [Rhipicephalus sanguineus]